MEIDRILIGKDDFQIAQRIVRARALDQLVVVGGDWIGPVYRGGGDRLTRGSFNPGDQVTVTGFPSRTGTPNSMIQKIVMTADGSVVVDRTGNEDPDGIP